MRALELQARGDVEPELVVNEDADQVNLEHILPKSAKTAEWPGFSTDHQRANVHRVGNLCLLQKGPNGRIGNKDWASKRPILAASLLQLTSEAAAYQDWTPKTIEKRQEDLAALAVKTCPRSPWP